MACGCKKKGKRAKQVTRTQTQTLVRTRIERCSKCEYYVGPKKIRKLKDFVISLWAKDKAFLGKWPKCSICRCLIDFKTRLMGSGGCPKRYW